MTSAKFISRRSFLVGGACFSMLGLAGCARRPSRAEIYASRSQNVPADIRAMYAANPYERFPVPAVNLRRFNPAYYRTIVQYPTGERPGTIVVNTSERYLYLVREDGMAMRYGVGIGREGFDWSGRGTIARKAEWPTWTPPSSMIERQPELEEYRNGMAPGPENPLGARALYIYENGRDTLYRIHGNPDESSIGQAVSSGCVRMLQQDIIDLYKRVPIGSSVKVII